jgi:hypothetical protein
VEATQLFKITVSFGNVTSLISLPCYMSHASIPVRTFHALILIHAPHVVRKSHALILLHAPHIVCIALP